MSINLRLYDYTLANQGSRRALARRGSYFSNLLTAR